MKLPPEELEGDAKWMATQPDVYAAIRDRLGARLAAINDVLNAHGQPARRLECRPPIASV